MARHRLSSRSRSKKERAERQPTLADRFLQVPNVELTQLYHPKAVDQIKRSLRSAEKFVLDKPAAERIADVVMKVPDLLIREHRFAVAPFPVSWIEYPSFDYWMKFRSADSALYDAAGEWGDPATADRATGLLLDHNRINVVTVGPDPSAVSLHPIQYNLLTEWETDDQLEFGRQVGSSRLGIDIFLWGSTWNSIDEDSRKLLRGYNVAGFIPASPGSRYEHMLAEDRSMTRSARGAVGELRTIVAILLMINRPSMTRYVQTLPNATGFIRAKLAPYMRHRTITIDLDPVPGIRRIGTDQDDKNLRARHRVRGHYCHNRDARDYARIAGCVHEWLDTHRDWTLWPDAGLDEADNWVCGQCGGKRWWKRDHERGSAELGWVNHDYEVTDSVS
jgi:hypothetical protein